MQIQCINSLSNKVTFEQTSCATFAIFFLHFIISLLLSLHVCLLFVEYTLTLQSMQRRCFFFRQTKQKQKERRKKTRIGFFEIHSYCITNPNNKVQFLIAMEIAVAVLCGRADKSIRRKKE